MKPRKGLWGTLLGVGVVLVVGAVVWMLVAVPALVKYPTDLKASPKYAGTFTLYVDPATGAPLATPQALPMTIDRELRARSNASSSSKVVVDETITQKAGPLSTVQHNTYVMDRSTLKNIKDARARVFDQPVVDRSGDYRLNLPFSTSKDGSYTVYKNETASTYNIKGSGSSSSKEGLTVYPFAGKMSAQPVALTYLNWLRQSGIPVPETVPISSLKPLLAKAGLNMDQLAAGLVPAMAPADQQAFAQAMSGSVKLNYVYSFDGTALVEPTTGAELSVSATEGLAASPDATAFAPLLGLLTKYQTVPAAAVLKALPALSAAPPSQLFQYQYAPTQASLTDIAGQIKDQRNRIRIVNRWVPGAMFIVGFILVILGVWGLVRGRKAGEVQPVVAEPAPAGVDRQAG
jgi:hypothetical protein